MFNNVFYPTPNSVIQMMVKPYYNDNLRNLSILEPSAGKGDILDYLTNTSHLYKCDKKNVYAIESDLELVYILQGKGYKILNNDFLSYTPSHNFDLIVMNPPFNNGDEHLLKAWEIMNTGDIVCLLNAETINNPYTKKRQLLLNIINENGTVEYLGDCFKSAERKTNVNVALVRLHKEKKDERWTIDFDSNSKIEVSPDFSEAISKGSELAVEDKVGAYLHSWEKAKIAAVEFIKARKKLDFYASQFMDTQAIDNLISQQLTSMKKTNNDMQMAYNIFLDEAKSNAWRKIISSLGMEKYMTANLSDSFEKFIESQGAYELNRENIFNLIKFVCENSQNIMKKAVVDLYDTFCKFHKDNSVHEEGWKTNSQFKVNKKVILPDFVSAGYCWERFGCSSKYSTSFNRYREYNDIDKVMCYLSGIDFNQMDKLKEGVKYVYGEPRNPEDYKYLSLKEAITFVTPGDSSLHESTFFKFRCFKKGTLHIYFKSDELWARFNLTVNEGKKILGF